VAAVFRSLDQLNKIGWLSEIQGMQRKYFECYDYRARSILLKHNAEVRQSGDFIKIKA
jgi:hypothetical protein